MDFFGCFQTLFLSINLRNGFSIKKWENEVPLSLALVLIMMSTRLLSVFGSSLTCTGYFLTCKSMFFGRRFTDIPHDGVGIIFIWLQWIQWLGILQVIRLNNM